MAFISIYPRTWNLGVELSGQELVGTFITLPCALPNLFLKVVSTGPVSAEQMSTSLRARDC